MRLKKIREKERISLAELARISNLSVLTISRVEKGGATRLTTQRKVLAAINQLSERKYAYADIIKKS